MSGQLRAAAAAASAAAASAASQEASAAPAPPFLSRDSVLRLAHGSVAGATYEAIYTHAYPPGTFRSAALSVGRAVVGVEEQAAPAAEDAEATGGVAGACDRTNGGAAGGADATDASGSSGNSSRSSSRPSVRLLPSMPRSLRCPITWLWMASAALAIAGGAALLRRALSSARA